MRLDRVQSDYDRVKDTQYRRRAIKMEAGEYQLDVEMEGMESKSKKGGVIRQ